MFRTRFCLWQRVLLITMVCLAAAPAVGKGKPQPPSEPPTPPINYDITWFNSDGAYDSFRIHNINGPGTTMVGSRQAGGVSTAVTIDVASGTVVDLNTEVPHGTPGGIPEGWRLTSASGITAGGIIAGEITDYLGQRSLFVYDSAATNPFQQIGVGLENVRYRDMNENGDVLYAEFFTSNSYLYTHGDQTVRTLPEALMGAEEYGWVGPLAINNDRMIAGNRDGFHYDTAYVFDFANDTVTKIPQYFRAMDINNSGVIAGGGSLAAKGRIRIEPIHYTSGDEGGKMLLADDTTPGIAVTINEYGQSAGKIFTGQGVPDTGYIYDPVDGFWSLDDLVVDDTPEDLAYWYSGIADGNLGVAEISEPLVNRYPVIVGTKFFPFDDGVNRYVAFVLTPYVNTAAAAAIPEPASIVLLCFGTLVVIGRRPLRTMARHRLVSMLTGILIISTAPAFAQPFTLSRTFDDPTVTNEDLFGVRVALDGNRVLIAAPKDDTLGNNVGQVHLFDAKTGDLLVTFDNPTPAHVGDEINDSDFFGLSVALDGNHVLIGAERENTKGDMVGQAYLFDAETGGLLHTFDDPTITQGDLFGSSVAIDGNHVLIGALGDDTYGANVGQAHLFDATTGNLLRTFDDPTLTADSWFGSTVALDGNHVLIGAYADDANGFGVGQAHLFDATTGNLLHTFDDPTVTDSDGFGISVALDGNRVLIGAHLDDTNGKNVGQAHLFDATTGYLLLTFDDPTPSQDGGSTGGDTFGGAVALDGNLVLIGGRNDDTNGIDVGQAHLFDATTGDLLQTFDDPTPTQGGLGVGDKFGGSVALDGNYVLIGAYRDDTNGIDVGQAYLFTAVPEPSAIVMAVVCLIGLARRPCQRRESMG